MGLRTLLLGLCLLLTACAGRWHGPMAVSAPAGRSLLVKPYLARSIQALVAAKTEDDISHLRIVPLRDPGDGVFRPLSEQTGELLDPVDSWQDYARWGEIVEAYAWLPGLDSGGPVTLGGLRAHGRYRILALAYDKSDRLISKVGPSSVDVTLADDDATTLETPLPVHLVDTPFGATATLQLSITGDLDRLDRVEVQLFRLVPGQENGEYVTSFEVPAYELPGLVRLEHLQAETRYAAVIMAHVSAGEAPSPSLVELEVGQDDVVPAQAVEVALP